MSDKDNKEISSESKMEEIVEEIKEDTSVVEDVEDTNDNASIEVDSDVVDEVDEEVVDNAPTEADDEVTEDVNTLGQETEVKEQDEAVTIKSSKKGKKEKKPKKEKPKKEPKQKGTKQGKPKKKLSKGAKIGIAVGAVALTGGIIAFNVLRDDTNFYDIAKKVVNTDVGSFRFVVDVRTSEHGEEKVKLETDDLSQDDVENIKEDKSDANESSEKQKDEQQTEDDETIADQTDTTEEGKTWDELVNNKGNVSDTWSSSSGANFGTWEYPNYQLVIEGCTTSTKPLTSIFDVSLVTEDINDKVTTVTIIDDNMYVNLEQMKYYLENSQDSYFIALADELPENAKNMVVPLDEVEIPLAFSEDGEKVNETDPLNAYHRFSTLFSTGVDTIEAGVGGKGLSKQDDKYSISLSGNSANKLVDTMKSLVLNRSSIYDKMVMSEKNAGYLNDKQLKQLSKGKDNYLAATDEMYRNVVTTDFSKTGLEVQGTARKYQGGTGIANYEAELQANFTLKDTDYTIALSGSRTGQPRDIKVPDGSETKYSQKDFYKLVVDFAEHLNVTSLDLDRKLSITPDTISDDIIKDFVELVNSTDSTSTKITEKTALSFIERYKDYEETSETTPDDIINAQLVSDFIDAVSSVLPDGISSNSDTEDVEQFREVKSEVEGVELTANYDTELSSSKLGVIDITLKNTSDKDVDLNLENFNLQTMLSSKYPCNNYTTLRDYDNKFDEKLLKSDITVKAGETIDEKLYVVLNNGMEYMELFYNDDKMGEIIIY